MPIAQLLLDEFEVQAPVTRKFLERLPEDRLTWKPHDKSMSAGQLALHLAAVPGAIIQFVQSESGQAPDFTRIPQPASLAQVLTTLEDSVATVRTLLPQVDDAAMRATFRVMAGEQEIMAQPRQQFLRDIMFSHWYQHRGQFSVYLRLLGVPVPASWGPSADELPALPERREATAA